MAVVLCQISTSSICKWILCWSDTPYSLQFKWRPRPHMTVKSVFVLSVNQSIESLVLSSHIFPHCPSFDPNLHRWPPSQPVCSLVSCHWSDLRSLFAWRRIESFVNQMCLFFFSVKNPSRSNISSSKSLSTKQSFLSYNYEILSHNFNLLSHNFDLLSHN